jgi:hypothetical protein
MGSMTTIETEALAAGEVALVRAWRLERGGYEQPLASELAERSDIDLHLAVDLLRRGCAPELAAQILL